MRAGERLVGDHAQGVEVRPVVGRRVGRRLLRGHVRGRAHGQSERRRRAGGHRLRRGAALGGRGERLGDPEVGHHRVPAREQHVLGLEVAVHHALAVRVGEGVGQLAHEPHHIRDRQPPLPPEPLAQRLALHVGHRVVGQPVHLARGMDRHHVRVLKARRQADLAFEACGRQPGRQLGRQDLHHDVAPERLLARHEHARHPAAAELAPERVRGPEGRLQPLVQRRVRPRRVHLHARSLLVGRANIRRARAAGQERAVREGRGADRPPGRPLRSFRTVARTRGATGR
jgi:hypothetical protein